ncbi:MAG: hypothetical protein HY036_05375, partial [Nitrospirae bacterium]|nr:hypothetical protein [Nitrospirota bacterium]
MKTLKKSKKYVSLALLGMMFLSIFSFVLPLLQSTTAVAEDAAAPAGPPPTGKDVYYKTDGPISGPPAPHLTAKDYPNTKLPGVFSESRLLIWTVAQQHLFFGSFVLAVPIFCMVIELVALLVKDPVASK